MKNNNLLEIFNRVYSYIMEKIIEKFFFFWRANIVNIKLKIIFLKRYNGTVPKYPSIPSRLLTLFVYENITK